MRYFASLICSLIFATLAFAGDADPSRQPPVEQSATTIATRGSDSGRYAFAVKASMLGVGAEVATRVTHRSNLRAGYNVMGYSASFDKDGATYSGHLSMRTIEAHYDFFPWARSFHISPGMLAFLGDPVTANAFLGPNQSVTFGGTDYVSDPNNPARVTGKAKFNQVAPMITVGFGNLVHRDSKRFSIPFEIGLAFQGAPKAMLNVSGNLCDSNGVCQPASNPAIQQNIVAEQNKLSNDVRAFKMYPIISVGFGYKF